MLRLFEAHGRQGGGRELTAVLGYMALMEKQLAAVREELRGVRQELAGLRQPSPAAVERQKLAKRLEAAVQAARKQLNAVKESITAWAKDTVAAVQKAGASALDGAVRALHIRQGLEAVSAGLKDAAADVGRTAARVAAISARHRQAGKHLRNFGRALRGQKPLRRAKPEGRLSRGTQDFLGGVRGVLAGAARDADTAIGRLKKLERSVAGPSMLESVQAKKDAAKKEAPAPAQEKTAEASL